MSYHLLAGDIIDEKGRRVTVSGNLGIMQLLNEVQELREKLSARPEALPNGWRCWKCGATKRPSGKNCAGDWGACVVSSCRETKTCLKNDPLPADFAVSPLARREDKP